mmetsp:Transcript_102816/g.261208  ORF Transcript_102816/g.261208 Transcript_102816/m.261208 type:complete len:301 (-) Transcript_102816:72-974(-)|eukprot:CAMPEP_0183400164 /NCGR_PEP_ID=MMETSP0370-20130417/12414_1 /TAXON_ID=268820 /ORGANISM="Peridinium aciculiferum, Strain PAER-2" /LENGTH=300 /DNA_ID=CAMNT_0025581425 /DNA_START=25 /DNA_END=927 /DNA_ORIENTATION=-
MAEMQSEVANIVQAFKSWDETGTGLISRSDLTILIRALTPGITDADIVKLFDALAEEGMPPEDLKYEDFVTWLWSAPPAAAAPNALAVPKVAAPAQSSVPADTKAPKKEKAEAAPPKAEAAPPKAESAPPRPGAAPPKAEAAAPKAEAAPPEEEEIDEEARRRGLWQAALESAASKALNKYPEEKVRQYYSEVRTRLEGQEYIDHAKGAFFDGVDSDHDGKISFKEVAEVIAKSLKCVSDIMGTHAQPTMQEIRAAFDAHDTLAVGRGVMGVDEFLNLLRYLQVRVAEAAMPMSRVFWQD